MVLDVMIEECRRRSQRLTLWWILWHVDGPSTFSVNLLLLFTYYCLESLKRMKVETQIK